MSTALRLWAPIAALGVALSLAGQPSADGRELGFAVSMAQDGNLVSALAKAEAACMATIHIAVGWSSLRPDTLTWNPAVLEELDLINSYFSTIGVKLDFQLRPVNTVVDELPAGLTGLPYDDPLVVHAMLVTLDTVFEHLPDVELAALNISNESDALWGTDAARYTQFGAFLQAVRPHAKTLYAAIHGGDTLSVGTTFTWGGLTDPVKGPLCQLADAAGDHLSATYYGIQSDFTVKQPSEVLQDLDLLVAMHPGTQPIRIAEIGYPTGPLCNSSDALQSQFVEEAFTAWDQHADRIKYMGWFTTTDLDSATVDSMGVYYGITDPVFLEYLRTLGLRTWPGSGTDKPAYATLLCALQDRGFCTTACAQGLESRAQATLRIAPNPAADRITITASGARMDARVRFIAMDGRQVLMLSNGPSLDVSSLAAGCYAVMVEGMAPALLVVRH